eukprot:scaffold134322_cov26-Prasinocladus_malaysianus.AAC.2
MDSVRWFCASLSVAALFLGAADSQVGERTTLRVPVRSRDYILVELIVLGRLTSCSSGHYHGIVL